MKQVDGLLKFTIMLLVLFSVHENSNAQVINSILPDSAWQGQSLGITISGTQLNFVQSTSTQVWLQQGATIVDESGNPNVQESQVTTNFNIPLSTPTGYYNVHIGENGVSGVELTNGFRVMPEAALLAPPTLVSPSNNLSINTNPIDFSWSTVAGALNYEYEISTNSGFVGTPLSGMVASNSMQLAVSNGSHYWRVRTSNIASVYGNWSSIFQFTVGLPTTLSAIVPNSGYQGQTLGVTISGVNVGFIESTTTTTEFELESGGTVLPIEVVPSEQFNGTDFDFVGNGDLIIPLSAPVGQYDLSYTDLQNVSSQITQAFTVLALQPTPEAPALVSPINGVTVSSNPVQFSWLAPSNANIYQIQINTSSDFTEPMIDNSGLSQNSFQISLPETSYYWRVRAANSSNVWGPWSTSENFGLSNVTALVAIDPDQGYAGQNSIGLTISGINLPFTASTSTTDQEFWLEKNSYQIPLSSIDVNSPLGGSAEVDVPLAAPIGYYDFFYEFPPFGPYILENAFYVNEGNEYSGMIYIDVNQNQIFDNGDVPYPYGLVTISPVSAYSLSQANGSYGGYVSAGNYSLSVESLNAYSASPANHALSFSGSGEASLNNDFILQPIPGIDDLSLSMNAGNVRQGRDMTLTLTVNNQGSTEESGEVSVEFPAGMTVVTSTDLTYTVNGNFVSWNFSGLQPLGQLQIELVLFAPISFQEGMLLGFTGEATGNLPDATPPDNLYTLENVVVNSYDPNFKEVDPLHFITYEFLDDQEYLTYTIHFQNTGTAEALDIYVLDTISELLDLGTFQFISARHSAVVNMLNDRIIEFRFDGINLPDSTTNEHGSHGFASYRIKPISGFTTNMVVQNTGYIYFDFNQPIVTNTTENWIPLGINSEPGDDRSVLVRPNPSRGLVELWVSEPSDFKIVDLRGVVVLEGWVGQTATIDVSRRSPGIYYLILHSQKGILTKKIVIN